MLLLKYLQSHCGLWKSDLIIFDVLCFWEQTSISMSQWNSKRAKRSKRETAKMDKALCIAMATVWETMGHERLLAGPRLKSGLKSSPRFQYPLSERLEWLRAAQQLMG